MPSDDNPRLFPLADILSVTTPHLLSRRRMQGVCDLVDWMTFSAPTPDLIDLKAWGNLKARTDIARKALLRQHPQLASACPRTEMDEADLIAWLVEQERVHGSEIVVQQADVEMRELFDATMAWLQPVGAAVRKMVQDLARNLAPTVRALGQLAEQFQRIEQERVEAERELPSHPDIAELDAQLDGFYGDAS